MLNIHEMARRYNNRYPDRPPVVASHNWLYGVWEIGNNYQNKTSFYGAYPPSYLERVLCMMYPRKVRGKFLHLFSGSLPPGEYVRFDSHQSCDVSGNAECLSGYFARDTFDLVLADPPYSKEDAEKYGTALPNRRTVMREVRKVCMAGAILVWLDTVKPMYRKVEWNLFGEIAIVRSTNHRVRMAFFFEAAVEPAHAS